MPKAEKIKHYAVHREDLQSHLSREQTKHDVSRRCGSTDAVSVQQSLENLVETDGGRCPSPMSSDEEFERQIEACMPPTPSGSMSSQPNSIEHVSFTAAPPCVVREVDPAPFKAAPIVLSQEQLRVTKIVQAGHNVFFTGSAGTGKSILLSEIIDRCGGGLSIKAGLLGVTAATGIASVHIGGCTLHSWAGIGLGKESAPVLAGMLLGIEKQMRDMEHKANSPQCSSARREAILKRMVSILKARSVSTYFGSKAFERWRYVRTLIIDEISMVDGVLFDKLEFIGRILRVRESPSGKIEELPFGGIQLVLSGDFCQLPPVPDQQEGVSLPVNYAFDAKSWTKCVDKIVVLHRVFRQKDQKFVDMLNAMREGYLDSDTITEFRKLERPLVYDDGIEPAELFPTREEVETANITRLNRLSGAVHQYDAIDIPGFTRAGVPIPDDRVRRALGRLVALKSVTLKEGAQVMLIKNLVQGELVNGSIGRVVGFITCHDALAQSMRIAFTEAKEQSSVDFPVVLEEEEDRIPQAILENKQVWPVVQFRYGGPILCIPTSFEVKNPDGSNEARREQIPLILAWALSIHKSQGQTLERVRVNFQRMFENGQAYVAMSRATRKESVEIVNFDPSLVKVDQYVLDWMEEVIGHDDRTQSDIDDDAEYWDM